MSLRKYTYILTCFLFLTGAGKAFSQSKMDTHYAEDVFNKLIRTINLSAPTKPKMIVIPDSTMIAQTNAAGEIVVGYKLINDCRKFGADSANALAHILSHELVHYYSNHFWAENFGTSYADLNWGKQIQDNGKALDVVELYETQADEYGMYYAFSAGYRTLDIGDRVLDSVYTWFHLPEQLTGYPSRMQRKNIAVQAKTNIAQLIPSFETGNMLLILAQIQSGNKQAMLAQLAGFYFDDILAKKIQTKEIYNNAALARVISVLQYYGDSLRLIRFPFMVETGSMLYTADGSRGSENGMDPETAEMVQARVQEAEEMLRNAIKLDKNFYPAHINMAIIACLQERYGTAIDELDAAQRSMGKNHPMYWATYELQGIIAYLRADERKEEYFSDAAKSGSPTVQMNRFTCASEAERKKMDMHFADDVYYATDTTEHIFDKQVFEYLDRMSVNKNGRINITSGACIVYVDTLDNYYAYYLRPQVEPSVNKVRFIRTKDTCSDKTSKGLHIGSSVDQLKKAYGDPAGIFLTANAEIYSFPAENLLVWVQNGKVTEWDYWWVK